MNHFCTYCDQGYVARLLCLHDSLLRQGEPFRLHVLCFDAATEAVVRTVAQASLVPLPLREVLEADPAYAAVRAQRTAVEFLFTGTPVLVRHCLQQEPAADRMTYLDSDLCFYAPPSLVFQEQGDASVGIVSHRFPAHLKGLLANGTYNVAWVSIRRDPDGLACLEWWRDRCLEWCHDYADGKRYADQGYLDEFPRLFAGVRVLDHAGINAAPWNVGGREIASRAGRVWVGETPLLFYHFQGIREVLPGWFDPGLRNYRTALTVGLRDHLYVPYLRSLVDTQRSLQREFLIKPRLGYRRLSEGTTWRERWHRFAVQRLLPHYRRLRGRLIPCAVSAERMSGHPAALPSLAQETPRR